MPEIDLHKRIEELGSEFIDENFRNYPDQWAYLASIRKLSLKEIAG